MLVNKCDFNKHLKPPLLTSGSRKLSSNEFQTDGTATEKARGPNVLSGTTRNGHSCCHHTSPVEVSAGLRHMPTRPWPRAPRF